MPPKRDVAQQDAQAAPPSTGRPGVAPIAPEQHPDDSQHRIPLFSSRPRERERERVPFSPLLVCGPFSPVPSLQIYRVRGGLVACAIVYAVRFLKVKHAGIFRIDNREISTTNEQPFTGNRHPYLRSCLIATARYLEQGVPVFLRAYLQALHRLREPGKAVRLQNGRRHAYPVEEVCA